MAASYTLVTRSTSVKLCISSGVHSFRARELFFGKTQLGNIKMQFQSKTYDNVRLLCQILHLELQVNLNLFQQYIGLHRSTCIYPYVSWEVLNMQSTFHKYCCHGIEEYVFSLLGIYLHAFLWWVASLDKLEVKFL